MGTGKDRCASLLSFLLVCVGCSHGPQAKTLPERELVSNLTEIWYALRYEKGDGYRFPVSLAGLTHGSPEPRLFLCRRSTGPAGSISDIEQWTDFIYVGNQPEMVPSAAFVISPPENHGGKYGYVLFEGGYVRRLTAGQVRSVIRDPLCLATNAPKDNVAYLRTQISVRIPRKLEAFYGKASK